MPHRSAERRAAPPEFACFQHPAGDATVTVVVSGELDLATSATLDHALHDARTRVTVDLRAVTFMDCNSLSVLAAAADRAHAAGGRFRVVRGAGIVDRLFTLTGIERRLKMTA